MKDRTQFLIDLSLAILAVCILLSGMHALAWLVLDVLGAPWK